MILIYLSYDRCILFLFDYVVILGIKLWIYCIGALCVARVRVFYVTKQHFVS